MGRIGIEQVDPAAHLGQDHVVLGKRSGNIGDLLAVGEWNLGTIRRAVAELAVGQGHLLRVFRGGVYRPAEPHHRPFAGRPVAFRLGGRRELRGQRGRGGRGRAHKKITTGQGLGEHGEFLGG